MRIAATMTITERIPSRTRGCVRTLTAAPTGDATSAETKTIAASGGSICAVAVRDEVLNIWTEKVRGPLARLEATATDALRTLERDGYHGSATRPIRSIVDDVGLLTRVTATWRGPADPTRPGDG